MSSNKIHSLRPFIGCKDFSFSKQFYIDLGFELTYDDSKLAFFQIDENIGFYLQDYYVKAWIDNSMLFLEHEDPQAYREHLIDLNLNKKYPSIKISEIQNNEWGREFFLHDPDGILWHIGKFS